MNSRKIGVLGASGLIAREVISELVVRGYEVTRFSRTSSTRIGFQSYEHLLESSDLGAIVNLIGGHSKNSDDIELDQVHSIDALACEWSQAFGRPYVYISSGAVFGNGNPGPVPVDKPFGREKGVDPYTGGKLSAERRHSELREKGARISDVRMFSYAGPTFVQEGNYFLSLALRAAKDNQILYASGSEFVRDYVGARELVSAISNLVQLEEGIKFNLFSEQAATRKQILELFQQRLGLRFVLNGEDEIEFYCSQVSNLLPNYRPRKSLDVISDSILRAKI